MRALINKIIAADRVIHLQQLGIPWTPPTDPIFGFNDNTGQGSSQLNASMQDSSKHGVSKNDFADDQSIGTNNYDYKVSIKKIKTVFSMLIQECPYLIDDKAASESIGKLAKEVQTIQIDSIRKSLGIDNMEDVELLV